MNAVIERFLRYVQYDTTSSEESTTHPSTPSQLAFAQVLAEELSQTVCPMCARKTAMCTARFPQLPDMKQNRPSA